MKTRWLNPRLAVFALATLCLSGLALPAAAQVTGNVSGIVKDGQGGVIPGATVTLISSTRGTTIEATTDPSGDFTFTNVPGDTYTVKVTMDGFKTLERPNVPVSGGDRVALGTLTVELGALSETVLVSGEAPLIQSNSGERSFVATTEAVQNLPVASRNYADLTSLAPGVGTAPNGSVARLGTAGQNVYSLDGVSTMEAGSNGQQLSLNTEAIAEVKIVTQGYSAEYGRASGLQIQGITKSGSNQFRGSLYDIRRSSDWNSNTWVNDKNGDPKAVVKQQDWGYSFGGPVGKPGGNNKLFFFYSHEYRPRTTGGGNPTRFRVPTLLERAGDFSQSTDNNGALVNLIRDASTGLPCTAADTRGCFQDGGVLGRIPANRLYSTGLNILKLWPGPNASGLNYNYEVTPPIDKRLTQQPMVRFDYQVSTKLRLSAKYAGQRATVKATPGSIPGFNDTLNKRPFVASPSITVDYAVTPTMVLEGTWGFIRNYLGAPMVTQAGNRCNDGLCDIPFLYPHGLDMDMNSYQGKLLAEIAPPYLVNGQLMLPPQFQWGSKITNTPPNLIYPPFVGINKNDTFATSVTKLAGHHTMKAGLWVEHSYKVQSLGQAAGAIPFQGLINFGNDSNNPLDTGFGYANAALGIFSSYGQQSKVLEGVYIFNNLDWYLQDNWKASNRLTLDYGLRFTHQQPQYDSSGQMSQFFTDKWSRTSAPLLYSPTCPGGVNPCAAASRQALNPVTGVSLGANSGYLIGTIVAGTGNLTNGIILAGQGIPKENVKNPFLKVAPRVGMAYDLSGDQHMVLRGSVGLFFDRPDGDAVFPQVGNPPFTSLSTVRYSTLQTLGTTSSAPSVVSSYKYNAALPSATQWNVGAQMQLPWASALDVSYVGNHGFNVLQNTQGRVGVYDLNAVDFGAAYLPQNQDPTLAASTIPGATALPIDMLRTYQGYSTINSYCPCFHTTYHSIQTSLNRRMRNGLQFGVNYSYSISFTGNAGVATQQTPPIGIPGIGLRLQHNPDGSYSVRSDQAQYEALNNDVGNRPHFLKVNAVWVLPKLPTSSPALKAVGYVVNDWQLSGVLTAASAYPYDASFSYNSNGAPINLTGSTYNAKIVIAGDPGKGCSGNQYKQFNTSAFSGPQYQSVGLESGRNLLSGCPDHTLDLAIARNIPFGGVRMVQLRVDLFNALNTVVYNAFQSQMQMASPATATTIANNQYNADGTLNTARILPKNAGFGAVTGAQAMRTVQVQLRFQF